MSPARGARLDVGRRRVRDARSSRWLGRRVALVTVLAGVLLTIAAPGRAAAAAGAFEAPSASGTLGASITFTDVLSAPATPQRVELLRADPALGGDVVTEAVVTPEGGGRFRAAVVESEHVLPNTTIHYRFRALVGGEELLGPSSAFTLQDTRYQWQVMQGVHVRLHWHEGDRAFAQRALTVGDDAVTRVSALLGVTEEEPIDFFIYATQDGLDGALGPGTSEFVAGRAVPDIRTLFAEIAPSQIDSDWVDTVVTHELTHLVFDTATSNPYHQPPLWLNEGLAVYEAQGYDATDQARVRDAVKGGTLLPLTGLSGQFPSRQELFYQSYAEAVSAVDYFVATYGQPRLVQLIKSYAGGVTDDEAFRAAAGVDVAGFQAAWLTSLDATPPRTYGPRQPAAGPLPSGWSTTLAAGSPLPTTDAQGGGSGSGSGAGTLATSLGDAIEHGLQAAFLPLLVLVAGAGVALVAVVVYLARRGRGA
ncbi:MAG: peptidase MA family metallohydrolase [Candidatus Limnocylindrales bacterium]